MRLRKALSASLVAAAAAVALIPATASAAPTSVTRPNDAWVPCTSYSGDDTVIAPDQTVQPGTRFCVGSFQLIMQHDGNLVIYSNTGTPLWNSQTYTDPGAYAIMQGDGNFVVYQGQTAVWNAQTWGHPGAYTCFQTDGNLVVYAGPYLPGGYNCNPATPNNKALWNSGT
ncbi:hypothetical protein [Kitasatospora sp. LaBMicrA B282]|uniref:hypothetical protein n=1 Tax=Kitasatospora sp. LaBMicrA B282 TaxID=3420949 RepID=UPI003D0A436E